MVMLERPWGVLAECVLDAWLAREGSSGAVTTFSKTMALRRLHWKNSVLAELLYTVNIFKVGRACMQGLMRRACGR